MIASVLLPLPPMTQRYDFRDRFLRLSLVNMFSNLLVPLAGLIDVAFLGHLADIRHLAGVALATVLFDYIYWTFGFLRMGTTGTTAQAVGRGDVATVRLTLLRNGAIALGVGVLIVLLQVPLREVGFALLSAAPEVKLAGQAYYNALIWGAPAVLLNLVMLGWFLGQEQSKQVLLLSLISNVVNVSLNYLFIVQWGWAGRGAGAATAISQYAMLAIGLALVVRQVTWRQVQAIAPQLLDPQALKAAVVLNSNIVIRTFAFVTTFAVFTNLSAAMGTSVLAANSLLLAVVTLAAYFIDGIAFATESYAGIFHGTGDRPKLMALAELAGSISVGLGVAIALGFALFPRSLFQLLTNHGNVVETIAQYAWWLVPVLGFGSIAYMLDGYFLGLTAGRILRTSAIAAALIGFAPVAIAAVLLHSNHVLWLALSLFMLARAVTLGQHLWRHFNPTVASKES